MWRSMSQFLYSLEFLKMLSRLNFEALTRGRSVPFLVLSPYPNYFPYLGPSQSWPLCHHPYYLRAQYQITGDSPIDKNTDIWEIIPINHSRRPVHPTLSCLSYVTCTLQFQFGGTMSMSIGPVWLCMVAWQPSQFWSFKSSVFHAFAFQHKQTNKKIFLASLLAFGNLLEILVIHWHH